MGRLIMRLHIWQRQAFCLSKISIICSTVTLVTMMPVFAGAPCPTPPGWTKEDSINQSKQYIKRLESSSSEVMTGDNFPRRLRLGDAYFNLGQLYESTGERSNADEYFDKALAITNGDQSKFGRGSDQYHLHTLASIYLKRGDVARAMTCVSKAEHLASNSKDQDLAIAGILRTKGDIQRASGQLREAEQSYIKAIAPRVKFAYGDQIALAELYIEMHKLDQAKTVLEAAKLSQYRDLTWTSAYAKLLRASNQIAAAQQLESHVKTLRERGER